MSSPGPPLRRLARRSVWLTVFLVAFGLLRFLFAQASKTRGLVTPSGSVDTVFLVFGIVVLGLRFAALFVIPFLAVEGLLRALLEELSRRRAGGEQGHRPPSPPG
jgi:hypothetical protein